MLRRYARRLAILEAKSGQGRGRGLEELMIEWVRTTPGPGCNRKDLAASMASYRSGPDGPGIAQAGRSPDDEAKDLAAEVDALERRRQELEAEMGGAA